MKTEFLPFSSEMIPEAGKLLAERHKGNRERWPVLPARFGEPDVATRAVKSMWQEKYRNGAAYRLAKKVSPMIAWAKDE